MKSKKFKPFTVTLKWLEENDACYTAREAFRERFGKRVRVTEEILAANIDSFDMGWLVKHKTGPDVHEKYFEATTDLLIDYWNARTQVEHSFLYTKQGNYRVRINYDATRKAVEPLTRKCKKAELKLLIAALSGNL